jgi:aspartyl-tRNA(Asn)/glutamyl-tRNA(Gln) amidotransferase subunit A
VSDLGVREAAVALRERRISAVELTEACLARIDERNGGAPSFDGAPGAINAWARVYPELAREQAREADARRAREGDGTPALCGVPVAVKDIVGVGGLPLTASSRVLEDNVADADATAWARLRAQGMVLLGHTQTHEFAAGGTTDQVGNPWALDRVAGGSSGGSAAAVAARMAPAALGSDTCGSLRIPSACCGTSTIKATHGRVPVAGVIPLAPTLDHVGPIAATIADCAALLRALAVGGDEQTPLGAPAAPLGELGARALTGLTVALTDRTDETPLDPAVADGLETARRGCEELGARVVERPAPWRVDWDDLTTILLTEAWAYHAGHAGRRERYRPAIAEFVEAASGFTDAQRYLGAQARRAEGLIAWEAWFDDAGIDLVLEPTIPIVPYERGPGYERGHAGGAGDPLIALTAMWDLTGMPVASIPVSWDVGVSLVAPRGREAMLVAAAAELQERALAVPAFSYGRG